MACTVCYIALMFQLFVSSLVRAAFATLHVAAIIIILNTGVFGYATTRKVSTRKKVRSPIACVPFLYFLIIRISSFHSHFPHSSSTSFRPFFASHKNYHHVLADVTEVLAKKISLVLSATKRTAEMCRVFVKCNVLPILCRARIRSHI